MPTRAITFLLALVLSVCQAEPVAPSEGAGLDPRVLQMLPPNSGLVAGVQWRRLLDSSLAEQMKSQVKSQMAGQSASPFPGFAKFEEVLTRDIDSIFFAAPAEALANQVARRPGTLQRQDMPGLLVVKGRFNLASIREMVGEKKGVAEVYKEIELLRMSGGKPAPTRLAVLDSSTLVLGERRQIMGAIDRRREVSAASGNLALRCAALASRHDIWMIMSVPPEATANMGKSPATQMFKDVVAIDLGMGFADGMVLQANLQTRTTESAQAISGMLQTMLAMAASQSRARGQSVDGAEMLKNLRIQPGGNNVHLALRLSKAELDAAVRARLPASGPSVAGTARPPVGVPAARPTVAEPTGPKTIRITGLAQGPVEIPLESQKK
ncbi:MAG: hypothetical protein ACKV22_04860 [Bryobacteraceae bacterium]